MSDACTDCGRETVVRVAAKDSLGTVHRRCRQCHRSVKGDAACAPLARRCNYCSKVVHTASAPYIKTRDAYYCDSDCQKEERCQAREQRKISGKPPAKNSNEPSARETTLSPGGRATGGSDKSYSAGPATHPPTSSKSSPETSKTASFDRAGIALALRATGVDLPPWPQDCDAVETEPGRWLIGKTVARMARTPTGPRVVAREHGKWRVQRGVEVKGSQEFDPVGAWNQS